MPDRPQHSWRSRRRSARPRTPFPLASEHHVFVFGCCCVFMGWLGERVARPEDVVFSWSALGAYALLLVLTRLASAAAAAVLHRPALEPTLAMHTLLYATPILFVHNATQATTRAQELGLDVHVEYGLGVFGWTAAPIVALLLIAALRVMAPEASVMRRLGAAVLLPALVFPPMAASDTWSAFYYADESEVEEAALIENQPRADADLDVDPEDLLAIQDGMVDAQLAHLAAQRPGTIDLYALALGGDASESVFRNEVDLALRRFDARLHTAQRSLRLLNHVDTLEDTPLATRRNLARTLAGIGRIIDPAEDMVLVFLTSHGSRDHEWLVQLGDYALTQIVPEDLAEAFDDAGIRWRIAIVSACYSGGWIEPLRSPTSLVISSARADRTSFGCGRDAELTYFGRAFLSGALAVEDDLVAAFAAAAKQVATRERADGFEPSEPQIAAGDAVLAQLAAWRQQRPPVALSR